MELLLIMMDHNKINNSFKFKSNLGIKYQDFLMILQNLTTIFITIYNIQLHNYTILHNCHHTHNIKVYPNQLQQLLIPAKVRSF